MSAGKKTRWNFGGYGAVYIRRTKGGNERWYIDFRNENGKRIQQVAKHAQTRGEAMIELQSQVQKCFLRVNPTKAKTESICLAKLVNLYVENYAKVNKRSWRDDKCRLSIFLGFLGDVPLCGISALDFEKFKANCVSRGVAGSTINRYLAILKRMFTIAMDWGYASDNPVKKVKFFSEKENLKERILTEEEEDRLLHFSSARLRPIIHVALQTGMRRGEILNLMWSQIDFQAATIRVERTKSGKPRIVDINSFLLAEMLNLKSLSGDDLYVFLNPRTKKPFGRTYKSFKTACRKAGIESLRFHDLRHSVASRLVEKGVDLIRVKELLGHSTVRITERYAHTRREERKNAVELLCQKRLGADAKCENPLHSCDTASADEKPA